VNGWKKMREKLKEQYEKEFSQGTVDKTRVKSSHAWADGRGTPRVVSTNAGSGHGFD
jgi:hypothetical protein